MHCGVGEGAYGIIDFEGLYCFGGSDHDQKNFYTKNEEQACDRVALSASPSNVYVSGGVPCVHYCHREVFEHYHDPVNEVLAKFEEF